MRYERARQTQARHSEDTTSLSLIAATGSRRTISVNHWCIAPVAHKQGATLVRRKSDLLGLNKYMGEVCISAVKMNTAKDYTINAEIAQTAVVDNHADVPTLASAAMLVSPSISHWIGRKKDKRASQDVAVQNNAKDGVASVNKALLAGSDELRAIGKLVTRIRDTYGNDYAVVKLWLATVTD